MKKKSQGQILIDLIGDYFIGREDLHVAELGVWKSQTLKRVMKVQGKMISQYWAVDFWKFTNHWNYRHITQEVWDARYFYACKLMFWFPQLHVVRMSSVEASKIFPKHHFDLVFIDADHTYEHVMADIEAWLPLVKSGGLLTGHDYGGRKVGVKQAVDEYFDNIKVAEPEVWIVEVE